MAGGTLHRELPATAEEAAATLKAHVREGTAIRFAGAGTKAAWGNAVAPLPAEVSTERLGAVVEHNAGDFTAVLQAGVPLAEAQRAFAGAGQMLAIDPPLGAGDAATVGGIIATADSGPLRHRYGPPRDLVLGLAAALPDGSVARSGGKVIKNVAGYDLAKLFTGAFGTLGLIVEVAVRLHPRIGSSATAVAASDDPDALGATTWALAHAPLEAECLDVRWDGGHGRVLARFGGAAAADQATAAIDVCRRTAGVETSLDEDDEALWDEQRARQRSSEGVVVKVSGLQARLPDVLRTAERHGATLVGRAAHAVLWLTVPAADPEAVQALRAELAPLPCVVQDAPRALREAVEVWGEDDGARLELSRRLKARFDPAAVCNPGIFVGGI